MPLPPHIESRLSSPQKPIEVKGTFRSEALKAEEEYNEKRSISKDGSLSLCTEVSPFVALKVRFLAVT